MLYNLIILILHGTMLLASRFHSKSNKRIRGLQSMRIPAKQKKRIWIHCASAGEYEQALPIIKRIQNSARTEIVITFFSSSGMDYAAKNPIADFYYYLPFDYLSAAKHFIRSVNADVVIWIKYEFWYNLLHQVHQSGVPLYLINADLKGLEQKKGFYAQIIRKCLPLFHHIYAVSQGFNALRHTSLIADTKWIQAAENVSHHLPIAFMEQLTGECPVIVCGSVHQKDLKILAPLIQKHSITTRWIIVPHETDEFSVHKMMALLPKKAILISETSLPDARVIVVDRLGILKHLYKYAEIAYIGGGFDKAVHNVLEPAAFGVPIVSGPHIEGIPEAERLIEHQILFTVKNESGCEQMLEHLMAMDKSIIKEKAGELFDYIARKNLTDELFKKIEERLS